MNKRDPSKKYVEMIIRFDPNLYWKDFNLRKIHSFYLDIKTLKNLKRELPLIITNPLESFFDPNSFTMSMSGSGQLNSSLKCSEVSIFNLSANNNNNSENHLCSLVESPTKVKKQKQKDKDKDNDKGCLIF